MFDRFRKKASAANLEQPKEGPKSVLIENYKQMLPEFANFKKTITTDAATLAEQSEKRAETLKTLISLAISEDIPVEIRSILAGANLEQLNHDKLKSTQKELYKVASKARMQYALEILEGKYWAIPPARQIGGQLAVDTMVYSEVISQVHKAAENSRFAEDKESEVAFDKLEFKIRMIEAKDVNQQGHTNRQNAIIATAYMMEKDAQSGKWNNGKMELFAYEIKEQFPQLEERGWSITDKIKLSFICDRMLDNSVRIGRLTQQERDLIPRENWIHVSARK
ncbi:MAG: hypothetical protein KGH71_05680 [Candidatus Micrarchaeota archaeon]|nr:hypothetical protein [Candidatus Micrarchaeota archaeon]